MPLMPTNLPANTLPILREGFSRLLARPAPGAVVFVRCLPAPIVQALAAVKEFQLSHWQIMAVTDRLNRDERLITADFAVE